jgi:hypothetical protein
MTENNTKQIDLLEVKKINFSINNFIEKSADKEYKYYILNNGCIIFGKLFDKKPINIEVDRDIELSQHIIKINEYIQWLNSGCKKELLKYFNKHIKKNKRKNKWYNELEIDDITIVLLRNKNIYCKIDFTENILNIELMEMENKIIKTIYYDGKMI